MEIEAAAAAAATLDSSSIRNGPRRNTNNNNVGSVTGDGKESGGGGDVVVAGYGGGCVGVMRGVYLVWEDLTVVLPKNFGHGPTKRLLNGLNGFAQPGRILAIMGPSGSGKSTLLDSLAGRLSTNVVMTGNILLNGKKQKLDYGGVAYVTQDDVLLGTLTVRETITYSANLRLPPDLTKEDITSIIEGTILDLGLQDCADRMIGNWHLRGVSGGERRRLSIALETLTRPQILFLDEPTSGLDSAASFFVVQILRNLAVEARTVIFSIHQPSSEVFSLFDDLYLLSGGDTVYFGDAKKAVEFFREAGFPCPSRRNPADHFLRCVNADFDKVEATLAGSLGRKQMDKFSDPNLMNMNTTEIRATLVEKFKWSEYAIRVRHTTKEISSISSGLEVPENQGSQASWWKQLFTLTRRSFKNMSRDLGYYWMRIATYIVVALAVGTIYYDVGTSYSAILARGACGGFVTGFMTFMSIGGFPSFIEEIKVYTKERHNGHYGVGAYVLSNFISSLPYLIAVSLGAGTVSFYMVKFRKGFSHFVFYFLNLFGCISAVESCMMVVASVVPNFMTGLLTGAGIIGITMMTSGFFRMLSDLPKVFWRYPISYISFGAWSVQGAYKNDLIGLEFDSVSPGGEKLQGADIIRTMFGIPMDHSKWVDLAALYIIVLCYRVLFFLVLKFKERASPVFRSLYAKKTMRKLKKRASFRKPAVFSSNRYHQPPQPLSAQEGLSSPIPYQ